MRKLLRFAASATLYAVSLTSVAAETSKATIVLVHGAFADSSSWNGVVSRLEERGYSVIALANPLRGVKADSDYLTRVLNGIPNSVVLVGHSYGGSVISNAAGKATNVKALVFVAAFAPDLGESAIDLSSKYEGSTLAHTLAEPIALNDGTKDLYITKEKFPEQFAADVATDTARLMAISQRPITDAALAEPTRYAGWRDLPSWFIYGEADKNIPPVTLRWMASRARSKGTVAITGASHSVMVSHPGEVTKIIEDAVQATN